MRAVNLMPRDERAARLDVGRVPLLVAAAGIVGVTAVAFLLASSASDEAGRHEAERQAVERTTARLPRSPDTEVSTGVLVQERSDRVAALSAALGSRTSFDRLLREISFVFPADAWLTQLEATAPAAGGPAESEVPPGQQSTSEPSGVTIQGATYSHDAVATVLSRLAVVPSLENVRLTSTALVEPQAQEAPNVRDAAPTGPARPFVTFVVSGSLRTKGAQ